MNKTHDSSGRRHAARNLALTLAATAVLSAGSAMAASDTWSSNPSDSDWNNTANWAGGNIPGDIGGASSTTSDVATFASSSNVQVNPDAERAVGKLTFSNTAGSYIIGPSENANQIVVRGDITGSNTSTITFNSDILMRTDGNIVPAANQTFNFEGVFTGQAGLSVYPRGGTNSVINFNAGVASTAATNGTNIRNWLPTATVNINAPTSAGNANIYDISGTLNLNAKNIIASSGTYQAQMGLSSGKGNLTAKDAISGNSFVWVGSTNSTSAAPVATISQSQSYTGRRDVPSATNTDGGKRTAGTGYGTLVGYVTSYDPDSGTSYNSLPVIGQDGYTVSAATSANGTLYANNASDVLSGSATGNSDVNIVTGTLAGNGYIRNSDVTISIPAIGGVAAHNETFSQGVTLHKRQVVTGLANNTGYTDYYSNVTPDTLGDYGLEATSAAPTYGKLSPGAAVGQTGTLTMDLGSKGLNIKYAVEDDNTQTLLFDLDAPGTSDRVNLLNNTVLHIGAGGLELNDFVFTTLGGFTDGVYTLFHSSQLVDGTLGSGVLGTLGAYDVQLAKANGGQDIVLLVGTAIPEPASLSILALGALGLLARRRRMV